MALLPGVIAALFENETNPVRFENVCIDLYREAEGVELVPTSPTWDRGRDGRSISVGRKTGSTVLCVSLATDVAKKIGADIERLSQTTEATAIVFCSSKRLTEDACDSLEAQIRAGYPKARHVRVLGQIQLVALGERHEAVLRGRYGAEIANVERDRDSHLVSVGPSRRYDPATPNTAITLDTGTHGSALAICKYAPPRTSVPHNRLASVALAAA